MDEDEALVRLLETLSSARAAETVLDPLLDAHVPVAIVTVEDDALASRIVYVNRAFTRLTGYDAADVVGHSALLLGGARPTQGHVARLLANGRQWPWVEVATKHRPDGTIYRVEVTVTPLRANAARATHCLIVQRELSESSTSLVAPRVPRR